MLAVLLRELVEKVALTSDTRSVENRKNYRGAVQYKHLYTKRRVLADVGYNVGPVFKSRLLLYVNKK